MTGVQTCALPISRYGFTITANKDGRRVVSYTVIAEPSNASDLRSQQPKAPKVKTAKVAAPKPAKPSKTMAASVADIKAANLAKLKEVAANRSKAAKKVREFDDVTETFGSSGEVGTSFSVDRDFDSFEDVDLKYL